MATAAETYTWSTYGTALKAYLGVSGSAEDTNLTMWLAAAAEDCDDFVGLTAFLDDDGAPIEHPTKVKLGVFEWVKRYRERFLRTTAAGITSVRTGALAENYSSADAVELARSGARDLWMAAVKDLSLVGARP